MCINELVIVLAAQLRSLDREEARYTDDALLKVVFAEDFVPRRSCLDDLRVATGWALRAVGE